MVSRPLPQGGADPSRRRALLAAVLDNWRRLGALVAAVGVVLGVFGYQQLEPQPSWSDTIYAALQLLVLGGPGLSQGESTPVLLDVGRYLAAFAAGTTLVLLLLRFGADSADATRARRARSHLVVFGANVQAAELLRRMLANSASRTRGCRGVLIGRVDDALSAELRREGIAVIGVADEQRLRRVLRGAAEVVVAEADDAQSVVSMKAVNDLLDAAPATGSSGWDRTTVRVLLHSTPIARSLRDDAHRRAKGASCTTAVSITEAAAFELTGPTLFPPLDAGKVDHVVLIGSGELGYEVVATALRRRAVRGERLEIDLFPGMSIEAAEHAALRWRSALVQVRVHRVPPEADVIAAGVSTCCVDRQFQNQVFIVGLPDDTLSSLALRLASTVADLTIVAVLADDRLSTFLEDRRWASGTSLRCSTLPELVAGHVLLRAAVHEQLGEQLLTTMLIVQSLPGIEQPAVAARLIAAQGDRRAVASLGRQMLDTVEQCGWQLQHADQSAPPVVLDARTLAAVVTVLHRYAGGVELEGFDPASLLTAGELTTMLLRSDVSPTPLSNDTTVFDYQVVEQVAQLIHERYRQRIHAHGHLDQCSPAVLNWNELTAADQESNREQARSVPLKCARLGLQLVRADHPDAAPLTLNADMLETLANFEHARWMLNRVNKGWQFGPERNNDTKRHPGIVPFEQLSDQVQELDRGPIRDIPDILQAVGIATASLSSAPS
jgi:hypothetical protein